MLAMFAMYSRKLFYSFSVSCLDNILKIGDFVEYSYECICERATQTWVCLADLFDRLFFANANAAQTLKVFLHHEVSDVTHLVLVIARKMKKKFLSLMKGPLGYFGSEQLAELSKLFSGYCPVFIKRDFNVIK